MWNLIRKRLKRELKPKSDRVIKIMKKLIALLLITATALMLGSVMISCSVKYNDEELIGIFKEKYEKTVVLNEYIWGDGLKPAEYEPDEVKLDAYYVLVDESAAYTTKEAFIDAIKEVYVSDFVSDEINQLLFIGYGDKGPEPRYGEINGKLSINVKDTGNENIGVGRFLPETARVKKARGSVVVFTVTYEREGKQTEHDLMMRLEEGEWRFEAPTY